MKPRFLYLGQLFYRKFNFYFSPFYFFVRSSIRIACKLGSFKSVLDIGGGSSAYRDFAKAQLVSDLFVTVDISPESSADIIASAMALPLLSGKFDAVSCFDVLQHVSDPMIVLSEARRVLRDDGIIILTYPFMYGECDYLDFNRWTEAGILAELRKAGFFVIQTKRRGGFIFFLMTVINFAVQNSFRPARKSWRRNLSWAYFISAFFITFISIPTYLLMWIALLFESVLPGASEIYMGGVVVARKERLPSGVV